MGWRNWMGRKCLRGRGLAAVVAGIAVAVLGAATSTPAAAQATGLAGAKTSGISSTKHNLGSSGAGNNRTSGTTEICVFCHTPHAAEVARGPLWNRVAGSAAITPYTSATLTGGSVAGTADAPGSVSLACLSCHDGTQAMNTLINAPGSNGWTADTGATFSTIVGGGAGKITGIAAVGGDASSLQNDHPIGVKYAGGRLSADQTGGGYVQFTSGTINGASAWWVDTDTIGGPAPATPSRQKTDMWLYARTGTTDTAFVECASCHDPHTDNALFLRVPNNYSSVCLSCHIK